MYKIEVHKKYKHYEYCVVVSGIGHRCGYVKTEEYDIAYEKHYDDLHDSITCHGGLTYSSNTTFDGSEGYWIGFDCAHLGDSPDPELMDEENKLYSDYFNVLKRGTIRSKDFCVDWCKSMIEDIINMNKLDGSLRVGNKGDTF